MAMPARWRRDRGSRAADACRATDGVCCRRSKRSTCWAVRMAGAGSTDRWVSDHDWPLCRTTRRGPAAQLAADEQEATQRWGGHPVVQAAQGTKRSSPLRGSFALIAVALIVVVLGAGLFLALVGCLRRGEIVLVWFLR